MFKVTCHDDFNIAVNSIAAAESLGLGWFLIRSDRCPLVERQQQTGEAPSEEEFEHHCSEHDHLPEYVLVVTDERTPTAIVNSVVTGIEATLDCEMHDPITGESLIPPASDN
jgi:hypothetical protein